MEHNLEILSESLRVALRQSRKPIALLLGAGASAALKDDHGNPLIPALADLSTAVAADLGVTQGTQLSTLIADLPTEEQQNIEAVLGYVRSLAGLPGSRPIRDLDADALRALDGAICTAISENVRVPLPHGSSPYASMARWIAAVARERAPEIYTTNYDLLIEEALERLGVPTFDGFLGSVRPMFDLQAIEEDLIPGRWVRIWKLHGSINWRQDDEGRVVRDADDDGTSRQMIYPSHLKYEQSRRMPHLALLDRLKAFLRTPGAIMVAAGFSFRDDHILEVVAQSLRSSGTTTLFALMHGPLGDYPRLLELARVIPNLIVLGRDGAVVGGAEGLWEGSSSVPFVLGDFRELGGFFDTLVGPNPASDADAD